MSIKLVFIILGVIFYVVRQLSKSSGETKNAQAPRTAKQANSRGAMNKPKSIDDIFNEFVKEVESANKKPTKEVKPMVPPQLKTSAKSRSLDWQEVSKSNIKSKDQLIDPEDYYGVSHRVDKAHQIPSTAEIVTTEGEVFEFDLDNVDWQSSIITKEILDRKYV